MLIELILAEIHERARQAVYDEQRVADTILQNKNRESIAYLATYQRELKAAVERLTQLDNVIQTLYEDRVRGVITDSMFKNLMPKYEREREDKTAAVQILRNKVEKSEREWCDVSAWMKTIRKYTELETLTQDVLLELIDRIEVFEPKRERGRRVCRVRIVFRFVDDVSESLAGLGSEGEAYGQAV